jgi:hypothetical protein
MGRRPSATLSKNISKDERQHRGLSAPLRSGRDDKGEGGAFRREKIVNVAVFILVKRSFGVWNRLKNVFSGVDFFLLCSTFQ